MSNWDNYFLSLCDAIAKNSKCWSRKVGVVVVRDGRYVVATGYNGPPSSYPHCIGGCPRKLAGYVSGQGLHLCPAAHDAQNAVATAAKYGVSLKDCTLYSNTVVPCRECAKVIINAGIKEVVCYFGHYPEEGITGESLLTQCGVAIRNVPHLSERS